MITLPKDWHKMWQKVVLVNGDRYLLFMIRNDAGQYYAWEYPVGIDDSWDEAYEIACKRLEEDVKTDTPHSISGALDNQETNEDEKSSNWQMLPEPFGAKKFVPKIV